ncbi:MAG: putative toxin-antitoxin system toxin component, PIN family [Methylomonas sp.]|jgi:putative PIN family toxin of toxin-antitoxin system
MDEERIVVDTNVLISAAIKRNGVAREALDTILDNYQILQSNDTFHEIEEVIQRGKFNKVLTNEERESLLQDLATRSEFISISYQTDACRDPKDNKFLDLAVSGDKDLQDLGKHQEIEILSPTQFLERERQLKINSLRSHDWRSLFTAMISFLEIDMVRS